MKPLNKIGLSTQTAAALSMLALAAAQAQVHAEKPAYKYEKCYCVAKAGQNDCFTAVNSCGRNLEAGQPKKRVGVPAYRHLREARRQQPRAAKELSRPAGIAFMLPPYARD